MLREYLRRIGLLLGGLLISAAGITLMLQANIGLEPWSVLQQGMVLTFGMTFGTASAIVGAAVIAIAFFCGESFGLGTLANIFICPVFIDLLLYLGWIPQLKSFWAGLIALLGGMELLDEVIEDYQMYQDMVDSLQQKVSDLEKTNALLRAKMVELEGKERAISKDSNPMLQGANNVDILKRLSKLENEVFNNNNDSNRKH